MLSNCPYCGTSVSFEGRRQNNTNGHHNCIYYCSNCDTEIMSG